jgi:adenylate kinase
VNLAFLGPPGSGKGTQAKMLAEELGVPQIAPGDILRAEVRAGTPIGQKVKALIDAGRLAPDELTIELTKKRLAQPDCQSGFILDGFPRSGVQAEALEKMARLDKVIYFAIAKELVVERLSGRRSCQICGAVYHIKYNPPRVAGRCDRDGSELYQRVDDEAQAIGTRFDVYTRETEPLIERYRRTGQLIKLEAGRPIKQVFEELLTIVGHE